MSFLMNPYRYKSGEFSPKDIGNMEMWFDGSALTSLTNADNKNTVNATGKYDRLFDFSENSKHAVNTSSNVTYRASALNGKSSILIPDISYADSLKIVGPSYALDSVDFSFVFIADRTATSGPYYRGIFSNRQNGTTNPWFTFGVDSSGNIIAETRVPGTTGDIITSFKPQGAGPQIYIYRKSTTTGSRIERISSGAISNLGSNFSARNIGGLSNQGMAIGGWYGDGYRDQRSWHGDLFEMMYFKKYLSDDDILNIKDYIKDKWGINP